MKEPQLSESVIMKTFVNIVCDSLKNEIRYDMFLAEHMDSKEILSISLDLISKFLHIPWQIPLTLTALRQQ